MLRPQFGILKDSRRNRNCGFVYVKSLLSKYNFYSDLIYLVSIISFSKYNDFNKEPNLSLQTRTTVVRKSYPSGSNRYTYNHEQTLFSQVIARSELCYDPVIRQASHMYQFPSRDTLHQHTHREMVETLLRKRIINLLLFLRDRWL